MDHQAFRDQVTFQQQFNRLLPAGYNGQQRGPPAHARGAMAVSPTHTGELPRGQLHHQPRQHQQPRTFTSEQRTPTRAAPPVSASDDADRLPSTTPSALSRLQWLSSVAPHLPSAEVLGTLREIEAALADVSDDVDPRAPPTLSPAAAAPPPPPPMAPGSSAYATGGEWDDAYGPWMAYYQRWYEHRVRQQRRREERRRRRRAHAHRSGNRGRSSSAGSDGSSIGSSVSSSSDGGHDASDEKGRLAHRSLPNCGGHGPARRRLADDVEDREELVAALWTEYEALTEHMADFRARLERVSEELLPPPSRHNHQAEQRRGHHDPRSEQRGYTRSDDDAADDALVRQSIRGASALQQPRQPAREASGKKTASSRRTRVSPEKPRWRNT